VAKMVDDPAEEPIEVVADAVETEQQVELPDPVTEEGEPYVSPMLVAADAGERVIFPMPQGEQGAVIATED
jgi:hypothetical protein